MESWRFNNISVMPACVPHKVPNLEIAKNGKLFKRYKKAMLIQWVTDFDCGYETNWWYTIKDTPFDITELKSKRRYEINKGNKFFDVRIISSKEYAEEIYAAHIKSLNGYIKKRVPEHDAFIQSLINWSNATHLTLYGAFFKETQQLCGYALIAAQENTIHLSSHKTDPEYEKFGINAAIVHKIAEDNKQKLNNGFYLCDGSRPIRHRTAFPDYLEKYFGFRKAYCHLHIKYKFPFGLAVKMLYPFRKILQKLDKISVVHNINAILKLEEYKIERSKKA